MAPRVSRYMTSEVVVARPEDNLAHIRNLMLRYSVGRIVIVDEARKPIGIVTISDLLEALTGRYSSRPITSIAVSEIMTREVKTITPRKSIRTAAEVMLRSKVGGLPVVDDEGVLQGIITRSDLARAYAENYQGKATVGDLAREAYAVVDPYHSIFYVARIIHLDPAGKVIVVDNDERPIGVITKWDLAFANIPLDARMLRGKDRYRKIKTPDPLGADRVIALRSYVVPVASDIMTPNPITITPDRDAAEAAELMAANGIGVLPVVDDEGRLQGVITKLELMKVIAGFRV